jgi:NAD(P)-dependent dehydrogenase (short-subunit alcohol dehydrogenase family)
MNIEGCVALVTGANRGLGRAYVAALVAAGASKVYAGTRDLSDMQSNDSRVVPMRLDVTDASDVDSVAKACEDVNILINNAGIMLANSILASNSEDAMRREFEVNVFGVLRMSRTFSSILAKNGGGAIVNMLSIVSWFVFPFNATYCASKHAALAVTDGLRIELKGQGTRVIGVYAGIIDTDMAAGSTQPRTPPRQVAEATLNGLRQGIDHVLADQRAHDIWDAVRKDPEALARQMQERWDAAK